ncbi:hypothetical protein HOY82DRAFT_536281 [Tuber indicum]|nr:hypothetical protein HOY82DRAFT_536281 [Tuber indicum]
MSFYERMNPPCPPGSNPWLSARTERHQDSQPPCAQDSSFCSAFAVNPPRTLPTEHWSSLNNWVAHQKQMKLQEAKRQLAGQLYRIIQTEDFRAAALRQMFAEEAEWAQQQQQFDAVNGSLYHPVETAHEESAPDAYHQEPIKTGLCSDPPRKLVVYRNPAFANKNKQVGAEECYSNENGGIPNASISGVGPCREDGTGTAQLVQQKQDSIPAHARPMPSSGAAQVRSAGSAEGLAAFVAELKSQMAEKINAGDCPFDASTARGYEQYTRTPEFFKSRRGGGATEAQSLVKLIRNSQVNEPPQAWEEQMPNGPTTSGDTQTPDLYNDSQDQSQYSGNSFESSPGEPVFRSPHGPMLKVFAPRPAPPRSTLLQMTSKSLEAQEVNCLYQGYGVDDTEALHWQLPDWLWHHKTQENGNLNGLSYDFNYPPHGYAATPEFVELHHGGELDHQVSVGYHGEAEPVEGEQVEGEPVEGVPVEGELNGRNPVQARQTSSEYHSGCTPRYFMDSQPPPYTKEPGDATREDHVVSDIPEPLIGSREALGTSSHTIPQANGRARLLPPIEIPQLAIPERFKNQPILNVHFIGREAFMSDKAFNFFERTRPMRAPMRVDLAPRASGSPPRQTPQAPDPERNEGLPASLTPPNRLSRPVDSDPLTPKSPVFQKSIFPDPGRFDVHDTNAEHLFTPSPREPGRSPPRFILHTRESIRVKNRGETKDQSIAAIQARRDAVNAYLGISSELPALPIWPTPEPETPQSSPYPFSVDTPSPSVLVHKRHLQIRRSKRLSAKQNPVPVEANVEERQAGPANAQQYLYW